MVSCYSRLGFAQEDLDAFHDSELLWNPEDPPVLKDDLHSILIVEEPQRSTYDIHTAGREDEFDDAELALLEPGADHIDDPKEAKQGDDKPFDEDNDGVDKPGDDRKSGIARPSSPPRTQTGPAIGMTGTRDNNPPTAPQSNVPSTPLRPGQPTGAPTTPSTSGGAPNPNVNKPTIAPTIPVRPSTPARPVPAPGDTFTAKVVPEPKK